MVSKEDPRLVIRYEDLPPEGQEAPPVKVKHDPLAVLSLVLGGLSIVFAGVAIGPLAIITAIAALSRLRNRAEDSPRLPLIGLGLGLAGMVLWSIGIWWFISRTPKQPTSGPAVFGLQQEGGRLDSAAIERAPEPLKRALKAHASVYLEYREGGVWRRSASGSATVISVSEGVIHLLTCRHVVQSVGSPGEHRIRLEWFGGRSEDVQVLWMSQSHADLALLRCSSSREQVLPEPVPLGSAEKAAVGQGVFAVGDPLNFRGSLVRGVISAIRTREDVQPRVVLIQSQLPLNPGNSGGGMYSEEGALIGINSWTVAKDKGEGMGFSVAIDNLWSLLGEMPEPVAHEMKRIRMADAKPDGLMNSRKLRR